MKRHTSIIFLLPAMACLVLASCYKDKGNYDYRDAVEVEFLTADYTFLTSQQFTIKPPISISQDVDPDYLFDFKWYIGSELVSTESVLKHSIAKAGKYRLTIRMTDKKEGDVYLNSDYFININSDVGWGWMILSEKTGNSNLSFISPYLDGAKYDIFENLNDGQVLGTDPHSINYFFAMNTIHGFYGGGLPYVLINQGSGSVTLDGNSLKKDMELSYEFTNSTEPDDLYIKSFAAKEYFYAIHDAAKGEVYLRNVGSSNKDVQPYFGSYAASPVEFDKPNTRISLMKPFNEFYYQCLSKDNVIMYDEANARFIGFYKYSDNNNTDPYPPETVYFQNYDQRLEDDFPAGVKRVDDMGIGTKVLDLTSSEYAGYDPEAIGIGVVFWATYTSLIESGGSHYIHSWTVEKQSRTSHVITATDQYPFCASDILNDNSVVKLSGEFKKNRYFYFTDGDKNLYISNIDANNYKLAYSASSKITGIYPSPIYCAFSNHVGVGNPEWANFRIALSLDDGSVDIVDVSTQNMVRLFEGQSINLHMKSYSGFGDIKGMVWCTRGISDEY